MDTPVLFMSMDQHMYSNTFAHLSNTACPGRFEHPGSKQVVSGGSLDSSTLSYDDDSSDSECFQLQSACLWTIKSKRCLKEKQKYVCMLRH